MAGQPKPAKYQTNQGRVANEAHPQLEYSIKMKKTAAAIIFFAVVIWLILMIQMCSSQTIAVNTDTSPVVDGERAVLIKGKVAGDWKTWLVIEAHNGVYWKTDGFDPSYVRVVSDYKPLFRHLPNGSWEICFTSEIAQHIP